MRIAALCIWILAALSASSLALSAPSATQAKEITLAIGSITDEYIGQAVTVRARIVDVRSDGSAVHFVLDDRTDKIEMALPQRAYNQKTDRAGLNYDADVRVTGTVVEVEEVLQLDVADGKTAVILTPGSSDKIAVRNVDVLGTRYAGVGAVVAVEGSITQVTSSASDLTLNISDATGTVRVRLINRLLRYAPSESSLVIGASIRVVGRVGHSGRLGIQLTPALGYDVKLKK